MPEYLAPGVFVEEVSYRAKAIEGVSTTTTGFVGPTRYGPTEEEPEVITSLVEFERTYGDRQRLVFAQEDDPETILDPAHNHMWHAARAFFENGGKRLYVRRGFRPLDEEEGETSDGRAYDGRAFATLPDGSDPDDADIVIRARFPGAAGARRVIITLRLGQNAVTLGADGEARLTGLQDRDVVWVSDLGSPPHPPASPPVVGRFWRIERQVQPGGDVSWTLHGPLGDPPASPPRLSDLRLDLEAPEWSDQVRIVTATLTVAAAEEGASDQVWADLALDPLHERAGLPDSLFALFEERPPDRADARNLPIVVTAGDDIEDGLEVLAALLREGGDQLRDAVVRAASPQAPSDDEERSVPLRLEGGNDGRRPTADEYEGKSSLDSNLKTGLKSLEDIEDISIIAAPGSSLGYEDGYRQQAVTIMNLLIGHAERMRYRIAVLDSGDGQTLAQVRAMRAQVDSKHAAFYYPWVRVLDPVTQQPIPLPPSGFVAGIYARNDVNRAVFKAPANEAVMLALGFEVNLNKAQQEVLNPQGINCFRFFEGRGNRLWGARLASSDPEWKYVNLRRYLAYLERSIDIGTQWAVFEVNAEPLWANVRRTVSEFLFNEWMQGAFLGERPEQAYFVKCDRSTMSQNDLDNGRLVCLVGVAVVRPAEFVIFRIGQWTAEAKR